MSLLSFPTTFDFLSDMDDTAVYGRREYAVRLDPRNTEATNSGLQIGVGNLPKEIKKSHQKDSLRSNTLGMMLH